nr:unnamed protein product [Callosobruchus chinensis]
MSLAQPNATGVCTTDALIITGGAGNVPVICGENTGQHIYVDFNGNDNIIMTLTTGASSNLGRNWNIKVTQIACACPTRDCRQYAYVVTYSNMFFAAPSGCLQFFNTTSGTVNSFNFGTGGNSIDPNTGYCSIQWSSNNFVVSGVPQANFGALTNGDCTTDFVVIPNPSYVNGTPVNSDRFCGTAFNTVTTSSKPFVMTVVTNGDEANDVQNEGFSMSFMQLPCTNDVVAMVYNCKRKTDRVAWSETNLKNAMIEAERSTILTASKRYGIPYATLHRHIKSGSSEKKLGRFKKVFSDEEEAELLKFLQKLDDRSCGQSSSQNNTYFFNKNYPNAVSTGLQCTFRIIPCNSNICQVNGNGNCIFDSLVITGSASGNVPILCGENSGQHMYLMVDGTNPISITITTSIAASLERSWNIKVTQIACDCPTLGSRQIANENYGVCIGMVPGHCSIQWSQSSGETTSFSMSNDTATAAVIGGLPSNGLLGENCTTDYVVIPNPYFVNGTSVNVDRFCGNLFPTIITSSKPFVLRVVTDNNEVGDAANRGFSLDYTQQACSNIGFMLFNMS